MRAVAFSDDAGDAAVRERWTQRLGPAATAGEVETVVLVPPRFEVREALERLRAEVSSPGAPLRFVATGATIASRWPAWLTLDGAVARPIALTELDAYMPWRRAESLARVTPFFEAWLDDVLAPVAPGTRGALSFWAAAGQRHFDFVAEAWLVAVGVHAAHPTSPVRCLDEGWSGYQLLLGLRGEGAKLRVSSRARRIARAAATVALSSGAFAVAAGRRVREFVEERHARARLSSLRASEEPGTRPRLWMGVQGAWLRASRPVLETIPAAARRAGERVGVLLIGSIEPGLRQSEHGGKADRAAVFPALASPELDGLVVAVDQGVAVERARDLVRVLLESYVAALRVAVRVRRSPTVVVGAHTVELPFPVQQMARLLSMDLLRVREAWRGGQALLERRRLDGATVIFPHATSPNDATNVQQLNAAGASTVELVHGITDVRWLLACGRTSTRVKAMWSHTEVAAIAPFAPAQRCVGGFFPRRVVDRGPRRAWRRGEPLRVLLCTSYVPRAYGSDPRLRLHYQEPIMREVLALDGLGLPIEARWRPHPGDDPAILDELTRRFPSLPRSKSATFEEDVAWCDLLATNLSSVMIEGLFYGAAVFVHEAPSYDRTAFAAVPPSRRFGFAASLRAQVEPLVAALVVGDLARAHAPEQEMRVALFGASGEPHPVDELLSR